MVRPNKLSLFFIASLSLSLFLFHPQSSLLKLQQVLLALNDLSRPNIYVKDKVKPTSSLRNGVKFELHTLPVDAKAVSDGDSLTVYVSITKPCELSFVPSNVCIAMMQRSEARARRDYRQADSFHKQIIHAGYRVLNFENEEVLARKYRIRLRGIDAPEVLMPYGNEAKKELRKVIEGKSLRVLVYGEDYYGRWWEREAREKQVGLWALSNPQKPWEWRKDQREAKIVVHVNVSLN
ncbi:unnamed protein product [Lupinus luteus]|uniref:TNase-like domain-containing protein n=1 Tax=Lupinus luteus TaxID=3873 RepID=A0AAV1W6C6_LUPLU